MSENQPRLAIAGTGALACLFGARLALSGVQVTLLGSWQEGLQAVQQHGVILLDGGKEIHAPVHAAAWEATEQTWEIVLVLVKSWQTAAAAQRIQQVLGAQGVAITLQNGLTNGDLLAAVLGEQRVASGITTSGATMLGPGRIKAGGEGVISIGSDERLTGLAGWLQRAGFEVQRSTDTRALLWGKAIINSAINPLTALLGKPNGELLENAPARALAGAVALESAAICAAAGIVPPFVDPVWMVEAVALKTADNRSSMLQDRLRGVQTEIDAINGALVHIAESLGMAAPLNKTLWQLIKSLEMKTA